MIRSSIGMILAAGLLSTGAAQAAIVLSSPFDTSYSITELGSATGVPLNYGGLVFEAGDPNTLLLGGAANGGSGGIYAIGVTRDPTTQEVTGFSGVATLFSTAPNIDGGLAYGPGGVLFYTAFPTNSIGEIKPGSTVPDKIVSLNGLGVPSSVGTLNFVPSGFGNAGNVVIGSYSGSSFCTTTVTADGLGTYDFGTCTTPSTTGSGPEGFINVAAGSPDFTGQNALVSLYGAGKIEAYQVDSNDIPIDASGQDFITGLSGAEGATIDPVTGDLFFSTFGSGNDVIEVHGLANATPEPSTLALLLLAFAGFGLIRARRRA